MLDVFNIPSPQNANYQEFFSAGSTMRWTKPRGAGMVRILLIGAGGGGRASSAGSGGGGSGGLTSWIGPALFIPDTLLISIGAGGAGGAVGGANSGANGGATTVGYYFTSSTIVNLLTANGGTGATGGGGGAGGLVFANNYFGASGIFSSVAGTIGGTYSTAAQTPSTTIFLSGGGASDLGRTGDGKAVNPHYSYPQLAGGVAAVVATPGAAGRGNDGYFITSPTMLGVGGSGGGGNNGTGFGGRGGNGGTGCGGGGGGLGANNAASGGGGNGGGGAAFIWAW
jgi:hypothetical protein